MNSNDPMNNRTDDNAWEEAMSRDFDARVRDLHEAPFDFDSVKGKARRIRRNRRAAVAGGILGAAAIITPVAVLANDNDTSGRQPDFADSPSPSQTAADPGTGVDYVLKGTWHQADGDEIDLPGKGYDGAVLWNDQLVATRFDGEVFSVADVVAPDGSVVDSFPTTGPVAVNEAGTTIAWVDTDGDVMTAWDGDEVSLGSVDLAAAGETVAYTAVAVAGGPSCYETEGGCSVYVNSGTGGTSFFDSHGLNVNPFPSAVEFGDVSGDRLVTYVDQIEVDGSCGGLVDLGRSDRAPQWETCDHQPAQISPDGQLVIGLPSYYDGLGPTEVTVLDAETGGAVGEYAPDGAVLASAAWTTDGRILVDQYDYDARTWRLVAIDADGSAAEVTGPVKGPDFDSPFTLVQH